MPWLAVCGTHVFSLDKVANLQSSSPSHHPHLHHSCACHRHRLTLDLPVCPHADTGWLWSYPYAACRHSTGWLRSYPCPLQTQADSGATRVPPADTGWLRSQWAALLCSEPLLPQRPFPHRHSAPCTTPSKPLLFLEPLYLHYEIQ